MNYEKTEERNFYKHVKQTYSIKKAACIKISGCIGWPDRFLFLSKGRTLFLEFKAQDGSLSPMQKYIIKNLKSMQHRVAAPKSCKQAIRILEHYLKG